MPRRIEWLSSVMPSTVTGLEENVARSIEVVENPPAWMCLACRGAKLLCGKPRCPIIVKAQAMARMDASLSTSEIEGSSPPGVFVGRLGYPKVSIGPMVPPTFGDTTILDTPEEWLGRPVDQIVDYRYSLVRGNARAGVEDAQRPGRLLSPLQELAMAARPVDTELKLTKAPRKILTLSEDTQPYGPSAPLEKFKISNPTVDRRIEKAYYDRDLKAMDAIEDLYSDGVLVTRIQRAFSLGMFGNGGRRRIVPTRWSITAVDSSISLDLVEKVKHHPTIDEYRVYSFSVYDNQYVAILMPEPWRFEWIEAWFPNTTWNLYTTTPYMIGDYEEYFGRTKYARVGGCYYSTRLAVTEGLHRERKQAAAVVLRETYPGFIMPLGVWNVRESIRALMKQPFERHETFGSALNSALSKLKIPRDKWVRESVLISRELTQTKITTY
ncbi:MAG TPA: Nre family DNA repair protein [Nitrososphaerales archaeon]|nr:Nre family DNA repair protein [Nitrososphaerales archaeon]